MKKALVLIFLIIASLFFMQLRAEPMKASIKKLERKISAVENHFKKSNGFGEHFEKGFFILLDTIMMTAPESQESGDFKSKVALAAKQFKKEGIYIEGKVNETGLGTLWEAFHLIKKDVPFEGTVPQGVAENFEAKLSRARQYLKIGHTEKVSEILLEGALILFPPPPVE